MVTHRNGERLLNVLVADQLHVAIFIIMDLDFEHAHQLSRTLRHRELPLGPTASVPARTKDETLWTSSEAKQRQGHKEQMLPYQKFLG